MTAGFTNLLKVGQAGVSISWLHKLRQTMLTFFLVHTYILSYIHTYILRLHRLIKL